jgi:hypothetical protein
LLPDKFGIWLVQFPVNSVSDKLGIC